MALSAGQEVDAYCTKCKMDLTHRIVAMVGSKPVKVECRTCKLTHVYRAPKSGAVLSQGASQTASLGDRSSASKSPKARSSASPRARGSHRAAAEEHMAMVPPPTARVHAYQMTEKYTPDQWIAHKTFGNGLILREIPPDKIEVRFESGARTLVHNRP